MRISYCVHQKFHSLFIRRVSAYNPPHASWRMLMRTILHILMLGLLVAPLAACPLLPFAAPEAVVPTDTPTPALSPVTSIFMSISNSATDLRVGETVTISGTTNNIGIPYYTLQLSSGAALTITYYGEVRESSAAAPRDDVFEIVSAEGAMNRVTFTLRALAPGSADASIYASGEVTSPEGAFMWSSSTSPTITLTVSE